MTTSVHSPLAPSAFESLKGAVRRAIDKRVAHAATTTERAEKTVYEWFNRNLPVFPPLDCALAIDEAAVIGGRRPELLRAYARELNFEVFQLPERECGNDAEADALLEALEEFGQAATAIREMRADGVREPSERQRCASEIRDVFPVLAKLLAIVEGGNVVPIGEREARG